ncbi:MAG TPA: extracellular solute-binding protein, partial [Anaerolineae bacterium]|nr:extracellular solute-binding protein [Anaerolineae bacterium]
MKKTIVVVLMLAVLLSACDNITAVNSPPAPTQAAVPVQPTLPPQPGQPSPAGQTTEPQPTAPTKAPEQSVVAPTLAPKATATSAPKPTLEPAEISFMMWGAPEELKVWQQIVDDFQAKNPNIKVKVDVSDWDSYWTKLKTLYAGGTPPDVFAMDAPLYPDWVSRGALLNLQPYIDATPGLLDGLYPNTLEVYKTPDGYYGLPRD